MSDLLLFLDRRSGTVLTILTLLFLSLETFYAMHRPLSHDEFSAHWSVVQVGSAVPYVDFTPYKPVLGYWVQLALLKLAPDPWNGYRVIRLGMSLLAAGTLFGGALWLRRIFRPDAVCLAYAMMVVTTSLVEWAIEVRLDMLTALFGFVSLLFLIDRRVVPAGMLAGLGFLISQKGAMFAIAGGMGLLGCAVFQQGPRRWRDGFVYAGCVVLPIALYVACWTPIASFGSVFGPTFGQETQLHALSTPIYGGFDFWLLYWFEPIIRNPLFYVCAAVALVILLVRWREQSPLETMLFFYGSTGAFIMLNIRQPWGYMFVLLVPTAFVMHCYLFSLRFGIPVCLLHRRIGWVGYFLFGLIWPLAQVPWVALYDPGPQRQTFELAEALLQPGEHYFAGFHFLPRLDAHEDTLGMVDTNAAHPVHALSPSEHVAILERFRKEPIRFLVYTTVIDHGVPDDILTYLYRTYAPFWGNIWIYAPMCQPADSEVHLRFRGRYTIETQTPGAIRIDGNAVASGDSIELEHGNHVIHTEVRCRLKLQPEGIDHLLNPDYRDPIRFFWRHMGPAPEHHRTGVWVEE